jgi:GNAT superfamily N-acetyltransferase
MPIAIRQAEPADADAVWPLTQAFATSAEPERVAFDAAFSRIQSDVNVRLLVAESSGEIVGYALASTHDTLFANAPVVWVEEVMVAESYRRRLVGSALMAAVEEWAAAESAFYVSLATRRAAAFYAAIGYEESATFFRKRLF